MKQRREREPHRPLEILAMKEADLHRVNAEVIASLAPSEGFVPDELLFYQLTASVGRHHSNSWRQPRIDRGSMALYRGLCPKDALESILARNIVALNNATMNCFERAAHSSIDKTLNLNLRYGIRGIEVLSKVGEQYENRRRSRLHTITVGKMNIEAGGQAIVGNVETGKGQISPRESSIDKGEEPNDGQPT